MPPRPSQDFDASDASLVEREPKRQRAAVRLHHRDGVPILAHLDPLEVSEYLSQVVLPTATDPAAGLTWRAIFYDSPRTLRSKLGLARAAGYAGGGFWALGYERGLPGYAALMADFVGGRVDPAPADPAPPPGSVPLCRGLC